MYLDFAKERLYGNERNLNNDKPDLERLNSLKLGKIVKR